MFMLYTLILALFRKRRSSQSLEEESNESLMLLYQQGDEVAFQILMNRLERPLFFFILRLISSDEMARDILQDTFLRVVKHAQKYEPSATVKTWVYTIARNLSIDQLRKRRMTVVSLDQPLKSGENFMLSTFIPVKGEDVLDQVNAKQIAARVEYALTQINSDQREVFLLREVQGYKFHEIAKILNQSENTIKSRMRYALQALRTHLSEYQTQIPSLIKEGGRK